MNVEALHAFYDVVSCIGVVGAAWVGLLIKNALYRMEINQGIVKAELVASQVTLAQDLRAKHQENRQDLAVHSARDEQQLRSLETRLERIEMKIDRANGGRQ